MNSKYIKQPKITVITATKNNVQTIDRTILSVINQSYPLVEYILVDGGSSDGTKYSLDKYREHFKFYISEPDSGVYDAWNKGLKLATGDWVCFLGADDFFCDCKSIETMVVALTNSPDENIAIVYGRLNYVDHEGNLINVSQVPWEIVRHGVFIFMLIPHVGTLHRMDLFARYGYFDETFKIAGDYDFILRVLEDFEALYVPNVVQASMTIGGLSSNTENWHRLWAEFKRVRERHPHNRFGFGKGTLIAYSRMYRAKLLLILQSLIPHWAFKKIRNFYRQFLK